jgi:hypothetical protein
MIERLIDNPVPIPSFLVVKNASKKPSACFKSTPMPESVTLSGLGLDRSFVFCSAIVATCPI